jgi:hypothetical protein
MSWAGQASRSKRLRVPKNINTENKVYVDLEGTRKKVALRTTWPFSGKCAVVAENTAD